MTSVQPITSQPASTPTNKANTPKMAHNLKARLFCSMILS